MAAIRSFSSLRFEGPCRTRLRRPRPTPCRRMRSAPATFPLCCRLAVRADISALIQVTARTGVPTPTSSTTRLLRHWSGSTVTRTADQNNILTNAGPLSPVALAYLKYYPEPNVSNPNVDGTNNYISNSPAVDTFNSEFLEAIGTSARRSHIFGEFHRNHRTNHKQDIFSNGASGQSSTASQPWSHHG